MRNLCAEVSKENHLIKKGGVPVMWQDAAFFALSKYRVVKRKAMIPIV